MSTARKATDKQVAAVVEALGRGESIPSGWSYNPMADPPVWKTDATEPDIPDPVMAEATEAGLAIDLLVGPGGTPEEHDA